MVRFHNKIQLFFIREKTWSDKELSDDGNHYIAIFI